jgi:precorrin-3B C17-methyltransferase
LTFRASETLRLADVIVGYKTYTNLVKAFLTQEAIESKHWVVSGMRHEVDRARDAIDWAKQGKTVAVVSSGDAGIYGMAGLIYELARERDLRPQEIEIVPGISALNAAASLLGAPLIHDFAVISLSDLLTPWETIARRLELAAEADFVIVMYNPKSMRRQGNLAEAQRIISHHRAGTTPTGIVRNAYREEQQVVVTDLEHLLDQDVDMLSTVIVGNSATFSFEGTIVTPRGYETKYEY